MSGARLQTLARGAQLCALLNRRSSYGWRIAQHAVYGLLCTTLTAAERSEMGIRLYDILHSDSALEPLHEWERAWFRCRLPAPPARILVAAAGAGREAVALRQMGYQIDALEPAPRPARHCERQLGPNSRVVVARLEHVAIRLLEGHDTPLAPGQYAAVIIGWGGLSHILDPDHRERVLRACDRLAPDGPILASFLVRSVTDAPVSKSRRLGYSAGRVIARMRRISPGADSAPGFATGFGFSHAFRGAEIEALAKRVGRQLLWGRAGASPTYPHATFLPRSPRTTDQTVADAIIAHELGKRAIAPTT